MAVDLKKLDREAVREALAGAETAIHRVGELLAGGSVAILAFPEDLTLWLKRVHQAGVGIGDAAEHLEALLNLVAEADPCTARALRESLQ